VLGSALVGRSKERPALADSSLPLEARLAVRRVHECTFGVLALESEPVDPRLERLPPTPVCGAHSPCNRSRADFRFSSADRSRALPARPRNGYPKTIWFLLFA
jgi:hypothetical protein